MPLIDQISTDMTAAMRTKEQERLDALRMIKAALMKYKVDTMKPLDEAAELQILTTLIKQRRESADMFRKGNRPELADKEEPSEDHRILHAGRADGCGSGCGHRRGDVGNRRDVGEADGRGDEGRASQARREARGRESAERESSRQAALNIDRAVIAVHESIVDPMAGIRVRVMLP